MQVYTNKLFCVSDMKHNGWNKPGFAKFIEKLSPNMLPICLGKSHAECTAQADCSAFSKDAFARPQQ